MKVDRDTGFNGRRRNKNYMNISEAADYMGLTRDNLDQLSKKGGIKFHRDVLGHRIYNKEYLKNNYKTLSMFASIEGNEG